MIELGKITWKYNQHCYDFWQLVKSVMTITGRKIKMNQNQKNFAQVRADFLLMFKLTIDSIYPEHLL